MHLAGLQKVAIIENTIVYTMLRQQEKSSELVHALFLMRKM